jgi:hypothetical protein
MEKGIVAITERSAVGLSRFGWNRRIAECFLPFDVRRPLSCEIALCRLVSVKETLLGGLAKLDWRRWGWRRRLIINGLWMSASSQSDRQ